MKKISFAVDLGTTTIDSCLIDDETGEILETLSQKNKQSLYGSDVINRIMNSSRNEENKEKLSSIVRKQLLLMLYTLLEKVTGNSFDDTKDNEDIAINMLSGICVSGNTTMISILLGYDVSSLGSYPFAHELKKSIALNYKGVPVYLTGCLSAFVGGDILSGLLFLNEQYINAFNSSNSNLFIDLGTNGEMVLNANGKLYACSTACGPAFEGCVKRQGVYGSNLIDTLTLLIKTKKLSKEGVLNDEFLSGGVTINGIHITMDIIREILMAKAAIYTGLLTLINEAAKNDKDFDISKVNQLFIAGGFGLHLDIDNASYIGLIPNELKDKVLVCGNTSLSGAISILKNKSIDKLDELSESKIMHVELANNDCYKEMLINNMIFGVS